jgi:hypothetical protein
MKSRHNNLRHALDSMATSATMNTSSAWTSVLGAATVCNMRQAFNRAEHTS